MQIEEHIYSDLYKYTKALSVALEYRDHLTQIHSERVVGLSEEIGRRYGFDENELSNLKIAASFHDIGKIGIPDNILLKPGAFEDAELKIMRQHPIIGEKIIVATDIKGSKQSALIVRQHHEYYNGLGYPDGLSGEDIPICSRIIAIADAYDAMAVTRPYHHARSHQQIMEILRSETGKKFDPQLMIIFCEIIETSKFKAIEN